MVGIEGLPGDVRVLRLQKLAPLLRTRRARRERPAAASGR
jgi:hypothetical protein